MASALLVRSFGLICGFALSALVAPACVGDDAFRPASGADGGGTSEGGTKMKGDPCAAGDTCAGSVCTDGFCCDSSCTDTCGACNVKGHEGTCTPVTGAPIGKRICKGSATGVCAGTCDGTMMGDCSYPTASCGTDSCTAGSSTAATCSMGTCAAKNAACADLLCGGNACATITQVAMGIDFACALLSEGTVRCWGDNTHGQLGQGPTDTMARLVPTPVQGLPGAAASIGVGDAHACAVMKKDGAVLCWGSNDEHQLGLGESTSASDTSAHGVPKPVCAAGTGPTCNPLVAATKVVGTDRATCATLSGMGAPKCWGDDGDAVGLDVAGTVPTTANPVSVCGALGGATVVDIAMGNGTACAVDSTGAVYCWGSNNSGKAGQATTASAVHCATKVAGVTAVAKKIAVSAYATCALSSGGSVSCWGAGEARGNGSTNNTSNAVTLVTPNVGGAAINAVAIAGGGAGFNGNTFCAAMADGTAECWGSDVNGEIGDGQPATSMAIFDHPSPVTSLPGKVVDIAGASSGFAFCAVLGDMGVLRCWGYGRSGSLGNNSAMIGVQSTPVAQKW